MQIQYSSSRYLTGCKTHTTSPIFTGPFALLFWHRSLHTQHNNFSILTVDSACIKILTITLAASMIELF